MLKIPAHSKQVAYVARKTSLWHGSDALAIDTAFPLDNQSALLKGSIMRRDIPQASAQRFAVPCLLWMTEAEEKPVRTVMAKAKELRATIMIKLMRVKL